MEKAKRVLTEEHKQHVSDGMKKAHKEGRAWNIGMSRWNNKPSYPEKFFMSVIENEFVDKNYKRELPFNKYSLDFAWEQKKLCIEIDGAQHDRFEEYKKRDLAKDKLLIENGWKVLRISWSDFCSNTKAWINKAKIFIDSGEIVYLEPILKQEKSKRIVRSSKDVKEEKRLKRILREENGQIDCNGNINGAILTIKQIEERNNLILSSNIDFSKFGWVNKVSLITGISAQKVGCYMKKHMNKFYNKNCFKRRSCNKS